MAALLRGVNVGGRNKLEMAELRAVATECGYEDVRTYIQSGNLVFSTTATSTATVAKRLREAIADRTAVAPEVTVRTRRDLADVVKKNPFLKRGEDPAHLHVVFRTGAARSSVDLVDPSGYAPEEVVAIGTELYLYLPSGVGRSRLVADLGRRKPTGTMRNWHTVVKLLEMADEIA